MEPTKISHTHFIGTLTIYLNPNIFVCKVAFNIWREPHKLPHSMLGVLCRRFYKSSSQRRSTQGERSAGNLWSIVIWTSQKLRRRWFFENQKLNLIHSLSLMHTYMDVMFMGLKWMDSLLKLFICVLLNYRTYIMWQISQWNWWGTQSFQRSIWLTKVSQFRAAFCENSLRTAYFWSQLIMKVISVIRFPSLVLPFIYFLHCDPSNACADVRCIETKVLWFSGKRKKKVLHNKNTHIWLELMCLVTH